MAIIVDKEEKRRNIALSCRELLLEHGIKDLTIAQIAQTAGVGKGTIYEYFANKEDIVFEIISSFIEEHEKRLMAIALQDISTKEKIYHFYFLFFDDKIHKKQLKTYREFIAISMTNPSKQMTEFSIACNEKITAISGKIIKEAIQKGELRDEAIHIVQPLSIYHTGLIAEEHKSALNAKEEIRNFLDTLFILMESKI
ncbi:MAG TPA: TetR/AcrR family transcriptional regulator [Sulfurovum sp.]|nr:TetR/AcrR family transcriptional regulator [Sulfurovum sp.]